MNSTWMDLSACVAGPRRRRHCSKSLRLLFLAAVVAVQACTGGSGKPPSYPTVTTAPTRSFTPTASTVPTKALGRAITLERAGQFTSEPTPVIARGGRPDAAYVSGDGERVAYGWLPEPGLPPIGKAGWGAILMVFPDQSQAQALQHAGPSVSSIGYLNGTTGYVLPAPHTLELTPGTRINVIGDALLWLWNGIPFRLETALPAKAAILLAESIHAE